LRKRRIKEIAEQLNILVKALEKRMHTDLKILKERIEFI
jgi:hypothetical protein